MPTLTVRDERLDDVQAIGMVVREAFATATHSTRTEHLIVDALRKANGLAVSVVADSKACVVGHAAASPISIGDGAEHWFGLGPVAVLPEHQRKGIGSQLVCAVLTRLQALGARGCVVVGDPDYYRRFGFAHDPNLTLPGVPPQYFMSLLWRGSPPTGAVTYHAAFGITA